MVVSQLQQLQNMINNLPEKTGKSLEQWLKITKVSGLEKHGQIMKLLKGEHGVSHGFANLIAAKTLETTEEIDLVASQYDGAKAGLLPIYEALISHIKTLGTDVEIAPKKTSVSLRRAKQFALISPASKTRIDLGLALKGEPSTGRLEIYNAMCSHRVRLQAVSEIDDEVKSWLAMAYDRSG